MDSKSLTVDLIIYPLGRFSFFQASLEQLTTRVNLLDGNNIDHIDMKLANILSRLNAINEKKTLVDEQDKQSKVNRFMSKRIRSKYFHSRLWNYSI